MTTTDTRRRAHRVAEEMLTGRQAMDAVALVAALEQVEPDAVVTDVRRTRYLVVRACNPLTELERTLPDDVVVVRWRHTPAAERAQLAMLEAMGLRGVSTIPCVLTFEPARLLDDGEGGQVEVGGHYAEVRIEDARTARWLDDAPPADRVRPVREWGLLRTPPPADEV